MEQVPRTTRTKVLYVITKSNWGGAQRYVYDLVTTLPRDEYEGAVAFGGTGEVGSSAGVLETELSNAGVRTVHIPELGRDINALGDRDAYRALRTLFQKEQPDVVHLNSSKVGGLGALAARMSGVKHIVFTAHGWPFWEPRPLIARIIIFLLSYITVLLSHHTITVSEHDRRAFRFLPFTKNKMAVIHNGSRPRHVLLERDEAREALFSAKARAAHEKDLWVITVAELTRNKNLFRAVDAVMRANERGASPRIFYTIIGNGEDYSRLEEYIASRGLGADIQLTGFVADAPRYLKGFDIFLLPSLKEGLPYAILEAGSAALPTIASKTGGIPEIIEDDKTGLLISDPTSVSDIASKLALMRDKSVRLRLATALERRISEDFSFERMRSKTIALYR